jgi:class 3 adenylate cyclase/tetratricopeptide (TPR) repeat protein
MAEGRKTVTIFFCDVAGSTSLGETIDPEALRRIMERYFEEARAALEAHGGTVEKFIGDAVMAVFGVPAVHEDDALRAVRAATELRERLAALDERISVRTGVNTGDVVVGDPAAGHGFVSGDAVNVAARLEQAAQPGDILIGEVTYRLVRDAVRVEDLEPLSVKGKVDRVPAKRLLEVLPDVPAFTRRFDAPFVGRERQLSILNAALEQAAAEGTCRLVTIVAPPGMGKSRLAREFVASAQERSRIVVGRCLSYGEGITYWPLVEIVRQVAGNDTRSGLRAVLAAEEDGELVANLVAAAVGDSEIAARGEEIFWAVRRLFEALAQERPLLVILDDVHWAEPTLLDLVEYVAGFATAPILVVCVARPDLLESRPAWTAPQPTASLIQLESLSEAEALELLDDLGRETVVPPKLRARIVAAAEGNPLFVEQLLAFSAEDAADTDLELPPTLHALLAARIDALEPAERRVIEGAAVEGRLFHRGAVSALLSEEDRESVIPHLMNLVRKQLVRPDRAEFPGEDAFRFAHILVREAAYGAISKAARAQMHERFASWLEERADGRVHELQEILGHHLEQAYRYKTEIGALDDTTATIGRRAAAELSAAGQRALVRGDVPAATNLLRRAYLLLSPGENQRQEIVPDLFEAYCDGTRLTEANALIEEAMAEADAAADERARALVLVLRAGLKLTFDPKGWSDRALAKAEDAVAVFEAEGDDKSLAKAWNLIHVVRWQQGDLTAARAAAERALAHAERAADLRAQGEHRSSIAGCLGFGPTPLDECLRYIEQHLVWARNNGIRSIEAMGLVGFGAMSAAQGHVQTGRDFIERGQALLDNLGMRTVGAAMVANWADLVSPDPADWERELRESYGVLRAAGEQGFLSTVTACLADAVYEQGRQEEAMALTDESEKAGAADDASTQVGLRRVRAKVLAQRGRAREAEELAREAVRLANSTEFVDLHAKSRADLGEVLALGGRSGEAAEALEAAVAVYEAKGNVLLAERVRVRRLELQPLSSPSQ